MRKRRKKVPKYVTIIDGDWYVKRSFPTRNRDKNGRIIYEQVKRICYEHTEEAVQQLADDLEAAHIQMLPPPVEQQTVIGFLRRYRELKRVSVSRRTHEELDWYINRFIEGTTFAQMPLTAVKTSHVQAFYRELALSPSLAHHVHTALSAAFNQAVRWDDLPKNPCQGVILPKVHVREVTAFDSETAQRFLEVCKKDGHIVLEFALEVGARPSEYLALTWKDIDLNKRTIRINKALSSELKGGGYEIHPTKTRNSNRTVHFSEQLRDRLLVQKQVVHDMKMECKRRIRAKAVGTPYQRNRAKIKKKVARKILGNLETYNLVFPSEIGSYKSVKNLNLREFRSVITQMNLSDKYSLYSLRHSAVSLAIAAGVHLKTVSEKHGTSIPVLLTTYSHVLPSMRKDAVERLSAALYV